MNRFTGLVGAGLAVEAGASDSVQVQVQWQMGAYVRYTNSSLRGPDTPYL